VEACSSEHGRRRRPGFVFMIFGGPPQVPTQSAPGQHTRRVLWKLQRSHLLAPCGGEHDLPNTSRVDALVPKPVNFAAFFSWGSAPAPYTCHKSTPKSPSTLISCKAAGPFIEGRSGLMNLQRIVRTITVTHLLNFGSTNASRTPRIRV